MRRIGGNPAQVWRRLMALTLPRERTLERAFHSEFIRVGKLVYDNVLQGKDALSGMESHETRVYALLNESYLEGMPRYAEMILAAGEKSRKGVDVFEANMQRWIREFGAKKVQEITKTTRAQINRVLNAGVAEGLGARELAREVFMTTSSTIGRVRSKIIARTETHSAANAAQQMAARSLDRPEMKREWVAAADERTRPSHQLADGQMVGLDEPFTVGGALLMQPGDPSGSPEETINCRCTVVFSLD